MEAFKNYSFTFLERFLQYVIIDTQSDPYSQTTPSTDKQKNLGRVLVEQLHLMGINDAELDNYGYVYATIPANTSKKVPVICFCSHMDTSPDCSGEHVNPVVHRNYQGEDLILPDDPLQVIKKHEHPDLHQQIGNDIVTAGGKTLLGADNKSGLAEIMDAANFLMQHPEIEHGTIKLLFTPDEEIGRGVDKADLKKLGADFAYTIDGETAGSIENETFSADAARIIVSGVSTHPGFAKGKMESAIKIASEIVAALPKDRYSPESTEFKEGFIHPVALKGGVEEASIDFIIRDFEDQGLKDLERILQAIAEEVIEGYPHSSYTLETKEQYRNMRKVLAEYPHIIEYAEEAVMRAGITPKLQSIRGGTDGSRLSYMGLPCPNIFAGEHAFHSKQEWVSVQDMEKAVKTIVNLAVIWTEKS